MRARTFFALAAGIAVVLLLSLSALNDSGAPEYLGFFLHPFFFFVIGCLLFGAARAPKAAIIDSVVFAIAMVFAASFFVAIAKPNPDAWPLGGTPSIGAVIFFTFFAPAAIMAAILLAAIPILLRRFCSHLF